ncbi:unnamed protein product [Owenia fusiformis]|uniref:YEATS domain-containing protein 2 n=1 Tax=Owenia fusiformis TaxID=6347 RepID=A0A8S4N2L0_OWEFU|nr:unnamed protein product [Owenia fusiformis]
MAAKRSVDIDPDYQDPCDVTVRENKRQRIIETDGRSVTESRIRRIIDEQFNQETLNKETEINNMDKRLHQARQMLDRLRGCIVANYYSGAGLQPNQGKTASQQVPSIHPTVKKHLGKTTKNYSGNTLNNSTTPIIKTENGTGSKPIDSIDSKDNAIDEKANELLSTPVKQKNKTLNPSSTSPGYRGSRFKMKKRIIVGNVSKYIPVDRREEKDQSTHKWMVYVRGPKNDHNIQPFVKKVWFFLHPSYRPNDLVEVTEPPFHLTRRGWGEFPIRVQLHFQDERNKRVDIIHQLKLDHTYTGIQTLGSETVVDVEIERDTYEEMPTPVSPPPTPTTTDATRETPQSSAKKRKRKTIKSEPLCSNTVIAHDNVNQDSVEVPAMSPMGSEPGLDNSGKLVNFTQGSSVYTISGGRLSHRAHSSMSMDSDSMSSISTNRSNTTTPTKLNESIGLDASLRSNTPTPTKQLDRGTPTKIIIGGATIKQEGQDTGYETASNDSFGSGSTGVHMGSSSGYSTVRIAGGLVQPGVKSESAPPSPSGKRTNTSTPTFLGPSHTVPPSPGRPTPGLTSPIKTEVKTEMGAPQTATGLAPSTVYVKIMDTQGKTYLIPQHLLQTTPGGQLILPGLKTPTPAAATQAGKPGGNILQQAMQSAAMVKPLAPPTSKPVASQSGGATNLILSGSHMNTQPHLTKSVTKTKPAQTPGIHLIQSGKNLSGSQLRLTAPLPQPIGKLANHTGSGLLLGKPGTSTAQFIPLVASSLPSGSVSAFGNLPRTVMSVIKPATSTGLLSPGNITNKPSVGPGAVSLLTGSLKGANQKMNIQGTNIVSSAEQMRIMSSTACVSMTNVSSNSKLVTRVSTAKAGLRPGVAVNRISGSTPLPVAPTSDSQLLRTILDNKALLGSHSLIHPTAVKSKVKDRAPYKYRTPTPPPQGDNHVVPANDKEPSHTKSDTKVQTPTPMLTASVGNQTLVLKLLPDQQSINSATNQIVLLPTQSNSGNKSHVIHKPAVLKPSTNQATAPQKGTLKPQQTTYVIANCGAPPVHVKQEPSYGEKINKLKEKMELEAKKNAVHIPKPRDQSLCLQNVENMECLVKMLVKQHPLIDPEANKEYSLHPYCAATKEMFFKWNVGKRRAAEWHRAVFVRKKILMLLKTQPNPRELNGESIWKTYKIVKWCRRHLFTPLDYGLRKSLERKRQKYFSAIDFDTIPSEFSSYSAKQDIDVALDKCEIIDDGSDSDIEVEIINTGNPIPSAKIKVEPESEDEIEYKQHIPSSKDVTTVSHIANQVGVEIRPVEVDLGISADAVQEMIFSATRQFTDDLLREACSIHIANNSYPEELGSLDIYRAINSVAKFDFLSNKNLGSQINDNHHGDMKDPT